MTIENPTWNQRSAMNRLGGWGGLRSSSVRPARWPIRPRRRFEDLPWSEAGPKSRLDTFVVAILARTLTALARFFQRVRFLLSQRSHHLLSLGLEMLVRAPASRSSRVWRLNPFNRHLLLTLPFTYSNNKAFKIGDINTYYNFFKEFWQNYSDHIFVPDIFRLLFIIIDCPIQSVFVNTWIEINLWEMWYYCTVSICIIIDCGN